MTKYHSLDKLSEQIIYNKEKILTYLGIEYKIARNRIYGPCPVHGGDKYNAWNFYHDGRWVCRTHGCQKYFKKTPIGLIRGILSHQKLDWTDKNCKKFPFEETIKYIKRDILQKHDFSQQYNKPLLLKTNYKELNIKRQKIIQKLKIPSPYFLKRGYSKEILIKYDVGLCLKHKKPMSYRSVIPVYDENMNCVGCTGRSSYEKCLKCDLYHSQNKPCPDKKYENLYVKYKHCGYINNHLYNYWYAKDFIKQSKVAIIVESPGNVWRLEEAGIHNSVAIFGVYLTYQQKLVLDGSGADSLIVIGDNDIAGKGLCTDIKEKCGLTYRLYFPSLLGLHGDIGDMDKDEVTADIKPYLDKVIYAQYTNNPL